MAWIVVRPGADPVTIDSLRSFASGRLASYKIPRYAKVVESFPMTVTGKVRKVEMRAIAIDLLNEGVLVAEPEGVPSRSTEN